MKIIGLAGTHASGKDTVAQYLVDKYGFYHISTSDIVRDAAMRKYGTIERPVLYKTANAIRHKDGYGALSKLALQKFEVIKDGFKGLVVSGFRAKAEAQVIKDAGGLVIFVDAPEQMRYERLHGRARAEEGELTFEQFKQREEKENGGADKNFDISAISAIADKVIINDKDRKSLLKAVDDFMNKSS